MTQGTQQDIKMAERRLALKEAYLPRLTAAELPAWMKLEYMTGISEERERITAWKAQVNHE